MNRFELTTAFAIGAALLLAGFTSQTELAPSSEYPTQTIREEQKILVGGLAEVWQLKWTTPPKPICEPNEDSLTWPCMGFAFGEGGHLTLVRIRDGTEIDHLDLTPFFEEEFGGEGRIAIVQRWAADYDKDFEALDRQDFSALVAKRRIVQVMQFSDYDHDGWRSEFYLQTEAAPCGRSVGVVIGISKRHPHLHVFGTVSKPDKPLYMQKAEWNALGRAPGPIEVVDWPCGDHGAETETRLRLRWTPEGVDGTRREYSARRTTSLRAYSAKNRCDEPVARCWAVSNCAERFALTIQIDGGISHADSFAQNGKRRGVGPGEPLRVCAEVKRLDVLLTGPSAAVFRRAKLLAWDFALPARVSFGTMVSQESAHQYWKGKP